MKTEITSETRKNMQEKLAWAERCLERMTKAMIDDPVSVQDHFWSFLHAVHLLWFYFGFWVENSDHKSSAKLLVETWKKSCLSLERQRAWNILGNLRDKDTHVHPVVTKTPEGGRLLFDDKTRRPIYSAKSGRPLCSEKKPYRIIQDGKEYELVSLCQDGLEAFQQFIVEFDSIE